MFPFLLVKMYQQLLKEKIFMQIVVPCVIYTLCITKIECKYTLSKPQKYISTKFKHLFFYC